MAGRTTRRIRGTTREIETVARQMRRNMTNAELMLWETLRGKGVRGLRFRRQHPVGTFVLDFYCPAKKLAIEIDGPDHLLRVEQDQARDEHLRLYAYRVLRFTNEEVLTDLTRVVSRIAAVAAAP